MSLLGGFNVPRSHPISRQDVCYLLLAPLSASFKSALSIRYLLLVPLFASFKSAPSTQCSYPSVPLPFRSASSSLEVERSFSSPFHTRVEAQPWFLSPPPLPLEFTRGVQRSPFHPISGQDVHYLKYNTPGYPPTLTAPSVPHPCVSPRVHSRVQRSLIL